MNARDLLSRKQEVLTSELWTQICSTPVPADSQRDETGRWEYIRWHARRTSSAVAELAPKEVFQWPEGWRMLQEPCWIYVEMLMGYLHAGPVLYQVHIRMCHDSMIQLLQAVEKANELWRARSCP